MILSAIFCLWPGSFILPKNASASRTDSSVIDGRLRSVTNTWRDARLRRWPSHSGQRSEEHTSELQSLMRISYAVFCLKKKKKKTEQQNKTKIYTQHDSITEI